MIPVKENFYELDIKLIRIYLILLGSEKNYKSLAHSFM